MAKALKVVESPKRGRRKMTDAEKAAYTPDVRFRKVAGIRVAKILKLMRGLQHCANPNVYEYTDSQVNMMLSAMRKGLDKIEKQFNNPPEAKKSVNTVDSFFSE